MAKLICFEGIDCVGKETQSKALKNYLESRGYRVSVVAFPRYNTPVGAMIKEILHGNLKVSDRAFHALYEVDRYDFMDTFDFDSYDFVILDRFTMSNSVFSSARGVPFVFIQSLQRVLPKPEITFILDLSVGESMKRKSGGYNETEIDLNEKDGSLLERSRTAYLDYAKYSVKDDTHTVYYVDASNEISLVSEEIISLTSLFFNLDGAHCEA